MTKYEMKTVRVIELFRQIIIPGKSLTWTEYTGAIGVESDTTLNPAQEQFLKDEVAKQSYKIVWKDGVIQP